MNIAERIKNRRIELGMTQEELATKLGYTSKTTIAKIEANANQLRQNKIVDIANALDTTPDWIMGWDDAEPSELDEIKPEQQGKNDRLLLEKIHSLNDKNYAILTSMLDTLLNSQKAD